MKNEAEDPNEDVNDQGNPQEANQYDPEPVVDPFEFPDPDED